MPKTSSIFILNLLACLLLTLPLIPEKATATPTKGLKVAAVQYPLAGGLSDAEFLKKMEAYVKKAAAQEADIVVFPEFVSLDTWPKEPAKSPASLVGEIATRVTPKLVRQLEEWAKTYELAILGGTTPRKVGSKLMNTAVLALPNGRVLMQNKLRLTHWEKQAGLSAGDTLTAYNLPWGKTTILICYDVESPRISTHLSTMEPKLLIVPSMTGNSAGLGRVRWTAQARVVEHHAFAVVTGTVGTTKSGWTNKGQAAFLGPQSRKFPGLLREGSLDDSGVVIHEFDMERLNNSRQETRYFPARDDKGAPAEKLKFRDAG